MPRKCTPCDAGTDPIGVVECEARLQALKGWEIVNENAILKLKKSYAFDRYAETIAFVDRVAEISEEEGHHPVMLVAFREVTLWWWTHKIGGLHANDFTMAAACDSLTR